MQFNFVYLVGLVVLNISVFFVSSVESQKDKLSVSFFKYVQSLSLNNFTDLSECVVQIQRINNDINLQLKINDAWGDVPSGVLSGNNMDLGDFDECLNLNGKYCLSNLPVDPLLSYEQTVISSVRIGTCMPLQCSADNFDVLLKHFYKYEFNWTPVDENAFLTEVSCTVTDRPLKTLDWIALICVACVIAILLISTTYDYVYTLKGRPLNKYLSAFSLRINIRNLFRISPPSPKVIPCLNGIRCLSTIWIVWGHICMMYVIAGNINPMDITHWLQRFDALIWHNMPIAVDTFFFLSGFLVVLSAFTEMDSNNGRLNVILLYVNRYCRLTPVLAVAVLFYMSWFRIIGNGPQWNIMTSSSDYCYESWWATLLYVQNYVAPGRLCLGHAWYLAVDMQLMILSPIVLILVWKWRRNGIIGTIVLGALLMISQFCIVILYNLVVFKAEGNLGADTATMRLTYYSTNTRTSAFLIGIIFGYYRHTQKRAQIQIPKLAVMFGWIAALGLIGTVIFVLYVKTKPGGDIMSPLEGAFYLTLSRAAWPLAICWLIFACTNGYGGFINDLLSWSYWQPLSKLSYSIYIWHMIIIMMNIGSRRTNGYFSDYEMIFSFWGTFGVTLCVTIVLYVGIEAPLGTLQYLVFKKQKTTSPTVQANAKNSVSTQQLVVP